MVLLSCKDDIIQAFSKGKRVQTNLKAPEGTLLKLRTQGAFLIKRKKKEWNGWGWWTFTHQDLWNFLSRTWGKYEILS